MLTAAMLEDFGRKLERENAAWLAGQLAPLPPSFAALVKGERDRRIAAIHGSDGVRAGNTWLRHQVAKLDRFAVDLASSDADICAAAEVFADDVRSFLSALVASSRDAVRAQLDAYAMRRAGLVLPADMALAGVAARMTDASWWRRALRRYVGRGVEQSARELGLVHRRAGLYCSDETLKWHGAQQQRNRLALEGQEAVNQFGQVFGLDELAEKGLAKAENRRADLMVRARGFDEWAEDHGDTGLFVTWTAPSAYHPRHANGSRNDRYQEGLTPRDAHKLMCDQWAKVRAKLGRVGIRPYGFRVVEPHHDGTPHWHMLLFVAPEEAKALTDVMAAYAREPYAGEMTTAGARSARFKVVRIDRSRGSAAGYIAKYIAKNIDGCGEAGAIGDDFEASGKVSAEVTAKRVRAWASRWGIRQFQQIGGPQVTVYRELRRLRGVTPEQGELFPIWKAADDAAWSAFVREDGGMDCPRADRPAQVWRDESDKLNRYGEQAAPGVVGIEWRGAGVVTREYVWEVRPKGAGSLSEHADSGRVAGHGARSLWRGFQGKGEARAPWTRVNNCTDWRNLQHGRAGDDGRASGRSGGVEVGAGADAHQVGGGGVHHADFRGAQGAG